ncbi:hypothetical protein [Entomospira culicis]|uniref:Uncharacterized protein n=1 Tax=Entomospira culicis TaxID=2719989 RepID=A0A968GEU0_9SPIO|nr:hypothetical protein [Entomospira culicis]NIZ18983.1 hypothetical protein [Entomospira culicis]NIZ69198.1 hypothetical protein [Entomospira culicis]WDI37784.1 hypothetical protein PVA46_03085 [Entomospira culicis]WDI39412.1 hypothetical protein PVA47_03090 [Entomospira culicis]
MGVSGIEQMAYLARQADIGKEQAIDKEQKRALRKKMEESEQLRHVEKSQAVPSMSENDKIEALGRDDSSDEQRRASQKGSDDEVIAKKSHYYHDPSLGGHIDISS